jgi:hypothetical protein
VVRVADDTARATERLRPMPPRDHLPQTLPNAVPQAPAAEQQVRKMGHEPVIDCGVCVVHGRARSFAGTTVEAMRSRICGVAHNFSIARGIRTANLQAAGLRGLFSS